MKKKTPFIALILVLTILSSSMMFPINGVKAAVPPKIVYVVINVDTELKDGASIYLGKNTPNPTFNMDEYAIAPPSTISQVFNAALRNSNRDSFGNSFKMTWYAEMDYVFSQANYVYSNGLSPGVSGYTATYDLLTKNWGTQIQTYGDSIEYHHHFQVYSNGIWQRYDNGPDSGYPNYQEIAIDHMIIDRSYYPSVFRSGWNIMSTPLSNWLEQWIPFDFTPLSGGVYPTHPYPGMNYWQIQTSPGFDQNMVDMCFAKARDSGSSIYSIYTHDNANMQDLVGLLQNSLTAADKNEGFYPNVSFKYVTARQAMQLALGYNDVTPPSFAVTRDSSSSTYTIRSSETLWGNTPYISLHYSIGTYMHMAATPIEANTWTITPPNSAQLDKIGVAASDMYGNPGVSVFSPQSISVDSTPTTPTPMVPKLPELKIPVSGVTASSYSSLTNGPNKAIDGIESTSNYWATFSGSGLPQWLKLDLWSQVPINQVITHFYDGDSRAYTYYIEVSLDGQKWTSVVPTKTGGAIMTDTFYPVYARYIRITVTGNTANTAAHIEEMTVYQGTPSSTPSSTPTPTPTLSPTPSLFPTSTPAPTPLPGSQISAVTATASSYNGLTFGPLNAIDGIESNSNYWGTAGTSGLPQWLRIDLGFATSINQVVTHFYDGNVRIYTYYIEASFDGSSWTIVVPTKTGSSIVADMFNQVTARYVRITVTGNTANTAAHIEEIKVYQSIGTLTPSPTPPVTPSPPLPGSQISAVTATASSYNGLTFGPLNAIDGIESNSNYWGTAGTSGLPQWLRIDLGFATSINQVVTHFYDGNVRIYTYYIEASFDGSSWTIVVPTKTGSSIVADMFNQVTARYVRITVTGNTANTAAHIEEIKVYQSIGTLTPSPTPPVTPSPPLPGSQISAVTATASSYNGLTFGPLNAIDGIESNSNYWGTAGTSGLPQWLRIDLGFATSINQVVTHFYDGNVRIYTYYIEASFDGSSWTIVVPTKTGSSIVADMFNQVTARYVRITVTGNTANTAAHIEEIKVYHPT